MDSPIRTTEPRAARSRQGGFTYLMLLFGIVLAGGMLSALGNSWSLASRREREVELLWRGDQYKKALASYLKAGVTLQTQAAKGAPVMDGNTVGGGAFDLSNSKLGRQVTTAGVGASGPVASPAEVASAASPASAAQAVVGGPLELADLLEDRRSGKLVRHLRRLYDEPITRGDWGVIRGKDGRIKGVFSPSTAAPIKGTLGVTSYRELVFGSSGQ